MLKSCVIACLFSLSFALSAPLHSAAQASNFNAIEVAQDSAQYPIQPSEAALIAQDANPNSKVLGVRLLPSGVYAVTLKIGSSVARVLVDATSGAIS